MLLLELHALTLVAHSYALLVSLHVQYKSLLLLYICTWCHVQYLMGNLLKIY